MLQITKDFLLDENKDLFNKLFSGVGERVIVVGPDGKIQAIYFTSDEFVAVPPAFNSPGVPGQKAWDGINLWYCVAFDLWVRFPSESNAVSYTDLFVGVPATLTSPGKQGEFAYDQANELIYLCVATNTWVRFSSIPQEYVSLYVAVPPAPNSPGKQGQRAYDPVTSLLYECVQDNSWIRYPVTNAW